jgi:hypothetical protein
VSQPRLKQSTPIQYDDDGGGDNDVDNDDDSNEKQRIDGGHCT